MRICGLRTLFLISMLCALGLSRIAAAENEADCADLSLAYDTGGGELVCFAGTYRGRSGSVGALGWQADWQMMYANSAYVVRGIAVSIGNRRTYTEVRSVRLRIEESQWFTQISNWGETYKLAGYDVARFDGLWGDMTKSWHCAGFVRYAVPYDAGYREAVKGYLCVVHWSVIEEERLRKFLGSITY